MTAAPLEVRLDEVRAGDVLVLGNGTRTALNDAVVNTRSKLAGFQARTDDGGASVITGQPDHLVTIYRPGQTAPADTEPETDMATSPSPDPCADCTPVGTVEIAQRMGVVRGTVDQWRARAVGFPAPRWSVGNRPAWSWTEVEAWAKSTGRTARGDV